MTTKLATTRIRLAIRRTLNRITKRYPEPYARVYRDRVVAQTGVTYRHCLFLGEVK